MKVIVDLTVIPIGVGVSLSDYVAACERVLQDAGLETQLHANGTNIEGEWDTVFAAIKVGTRTDRAQTMDDKIRSVRSKLGET
jgi:uncharacterized protein YqgV (UPF0045/DUF77 family)